MASPTMNRRDLDDQADLAETAKRDLGITFVALSEIDAARSRLPIRASLGRPLGTTAAATSWADAEEALVADPRGGLTPAQMVDQKLRALLGNCPRSVSPGKRQEDLGRKGALPIQAP